MGRLLSVAICAVLVMVVPTTARAAAGPIAVVNVAQVQGQSKLWQDANGKVEEAVRKAEAQLMQDRRSNAVDCLFSAEELARYKELTSNAQPTPEDDKAIHDLEQLSDQRVRDLSRLVTTPASDLTDQEKELRRTLQAMDTEAKNRESAWTAAVNQKDDYLRRLANAVADDVSNKALAAMAKVAKAQSISLVLEAGVNILYYFSPEVDISQQVVAALDEGYTPGSYELPTVPETAPPTPPEGGMPLS